MLLGKASSLLCTSVLARASIYSRDSCRSALLSSESPPFASLLMQQYFGKFSFNYRTSLGKSFLSRECTSGKQKVGMAVVSQASKASPSKPGMRESKAQPRRTVGDVLQGVKAAEKLKGGEDFRKARRATAATPKSSKAKPLTEQQQRARHDAAIRAAWQVGGNYPKPVSFMQ